MEVLFEECIVAKDMCDTVVYTKDGVFLGVLREA